MVARPRRRFSRETVLGMDETRLFGSEAYRAAREASADTRTEDDPHHPHPDGSPSRRASSTPYNAIDDTRNNYRRLDRLRDGMYNTTGKGESVTGKQMSADATNLAELHLALDQVFAFRDGLFAKEIAQRLKIQIGPRRMRNIYEQAEMKHLRPRDVARTNGTTTFVVREIAREVTALLVDIIFD